jgi:hypothetical protein
LAAAIKAKEPMPEQHPQMADIPLELAPEMVSAALTGMATPSHPSCSSAWCHSTQNPCQYGSNLPNIRVSMAPIYPGWQQSTSYQGLGFSVYGLGLG